MAQINILLEWFWPKGDVVRMHRVWMRIVALGLVAGSMSGCHSKKAIWIYTSLYKEVITDMRPAIERAFPGVEIRWFQGGSENVAARVNTELFAGRTQADLILTSDPFWYLELKKASRLLPYDSVAAREVPKEWVDPDHAFVTCRIPVVVMGQYLGGQMSLLNNGRTLLSPP
ncbi:hypothetical protein WDW37_00690 [Bdellovibrionota bacterium FG-1]